MADERSRVLTLVFTDLAGSTALKTEKGDHAVRDLISRHRAHVTLLARETSGRIVDWAGDGCFLAFDTPSAGVLFALRLQQAHVNEPDLPGVRIGIHMGEVTDREQPDGTLRVEGLAVDLAARIESLGAPGQVLMSTVVFDSARQRLHGDALELPVAWRAHGPYELKGFDDSVEICEAGFEGVSPLEAPTGSEKAHRAVTPGEEDTLGWRPAVGLDVPRRANWTLHEQLGEGGYGEVWLATHKKTKAKRVFKFCFEPERVRGLKREVVLFRLLKETLGQRDDIAQLLDWEFEEPPYFLESEYTEGGDLRDWGKAKGGLKNIPLRIRLELIAQAAVALGAAHSVGVLHKDIKPGNVLVSEVSGRNMPRTTLTDFGIGLITDPAALAAQGITEFGFTETFTGSNSSDSGSGAGTRLYMAPELIEGKNATTLSDIYSLGILLYQIVIGDFTRALASGWERDVNDELLREDIAACVDGNPDRRLTSAIELAQRLRSIDQRRAERDEAFREKLEARRAKNFKNRARRRRRQFTVVLALAVAVTILVALAGLREYRRAEEQGALRMAADEQRLEAEVARQEADVARDETERALGLAEHGLYHASIQLAANHIDEGAEGLARSALESAPKALRNWEWGYLVTRAYPDWFMEESSADGVYDTKKSVAKNWTGMFGNLALSLQGHEAEINSIAFDPLGGRMITAAADATVRIWNVETGEAIQVIRKTSDIFQCANFSPDGLQVVTASTYSASADIWLASTAEHLVELLGHEMPINQARFSPDGRRVLTVSADNLGKIWDARSGELIQDLKGHGAMLTDGVFTSDGERVYTAAVDGTVGLWEAASGTLINLFERDEPDTSVSVQMSPRNHFVVSAFPDGSSTVWNGTSLATINLQEGRVGKLDYAGFSIDESAVVAPGKERGALVWDTAAGNVVAHIGQTQGRLLCAAFSPGGDKIVTGGIDGSLKIWMPGEAADRGRLAAHDDVLYRAAFSPDGTKIVAASYDRTASVWDTESTQLLGRLEGHDSELFSAFFSADGERIVTTSWTGTKFWDAHTLEELPIQLERTPGQVELGVGGPRSEFALVIQALISNPVSPDGRFVAGPDGGTFKVWRSDTGQIQTSFAEFDAPTGSFAYSHDGSRIVTTGRAGEMAVWECETGRIVSRARPHLGAISTFAFSRDDSRVLSASIDKIARLWDANTGEDIVSFEGHSSIIVCARFSPDETKVVTASGDGTAVIWDAMTGQRLVVMKGLVGSVINAQFSPDGSRVLTMSLETATLWDLDGRELLTLGSPEDALLTYAQWSPKGDRILTCYRDGTAKLWNSLSSEQIEDRLRAIAKSQATP